MKKTIEVIAHKNLPSRAPVSFSIMVFLALEHWHAPEWLYGAVGFIVVLMWISYFIIKYRETDIDIFKDKNQLS